MGKYQRNEQRTGGKAANSNGTRLIVPLARPLKVAG
jgi:hypothetical protein